jgi:hypothetical protein
MCGGYAAMLASETPDGVERLEAWLRSKDEALRGAGWTLLGQLAQRDDALRDTVFQKRLDQIERTIHAAPNNERTGMNNALIAIGLRSPALRKAALAAAKRIGKVEIDHGDTAGKTPTLAGTSRRPGRTPLPRGSRPRPPTNAPATSRAAAAGHD